MEKITGFTTSQVIGKIPNEIFPFLKKLKVMEYKEKALLGETVNSVDYQYEIPENEKMGWATDSSTPLYNTEGKITGVITTFRDITERKAIEESLILRKNQLRQIIDLLPHYIYAKENNGNFILANKAVANFYGVSIKKMKGLTDIVFNQNAEIISCFTQGGKIIKEEIITHSDGSKRILETTNIPYKTIDDKTSAELCISIDVTKRKQDQELIIKLSKAVEQSANSIIITDIKGNIEYINPKFNTVSGYNNDEVIGRHITILDTGKQPNEYNREIPRTVRSGQIWKGEVLLKNKNGSCLWSQLTVSPIENKTGDIKNCLIIAEDITALKENELRLKTIINNIPDVVVFKDENKRWIEVNRAAIQLFNLEKVDCTGKTAKEFAPNSEFFDEIIRSTDLSDEIAFNSKNPYTFDKVIPVPNGNPKTYEFKKVPIFNNDHSRKGLVVIGRDITERMNKEKELMQAKKKAEQHDRLKTSFLQNISHEIRTPMNAIVGFSKMLGQSEFSLEKKKNFASIIINNSNQLLSIVTNILAISSIETQQEVIYERNVNINNELLSLFTTYKDRADEMGINFKFQKQLIDRQSEVYTDKLKLNQILTNLLNNAFKFTIKGEIEFGYLLRPSLVEETKYDLVFFVKDTGIGIEAQYLDKIFDCFVQLDLLENRKYGGNGIGLSVSKGFVELLGGKIWVESEREKGSIFYFSLPYKPVNSDSMSNLSKEQIGGNMKILIA
jgi:PAS domain S-box-containing protein